jgi:hypothetical protein
MVYYNINGISEEQRNWIKSHMMQCKASTLIRLGAVELVKPEERKSCKDQQEGGKCSIYATRPALCRSYHCHWKLWKVREQLRPVEMEVLTTDVKPFIIIRTTWKKRRKKDVSITGR